jgi:DNA polymerase I
MPKKASKNQPMLLGFDSLFESEPTLSATPTLNESATLPTSEPIEQHLHPHPDDLVILVDSHSLIYQVFHALPSMTSPKGIEVGAVQGFLRDIANLLSQWKPNFFVCTFDASSHTFRNDIYPDYKANRESMPDALREQLPIIHECLDLLAVPKVTQVGVEADDLMATLAIQAANLGARVLLVTSDKDCRQLINDRIQLLNVRKNELFGEAELKAIWGIRPDQVVDFQSLVGDSVDNVPGVPMIGPKAAQQLLEQFDSLDEIFANIDSIAGEKKKQNLRTYRDDALKSRELVQLKSDCEIELTWSQMRPAAFAREPAAAMFRELGLRKLSETYLSLLGDLPESESSTVQLPQDGYRIIRDLAELRTIAETLAQAKTIAIDTETTSTRACDADLVGISLCWQAGKAAYLPIAGPPGSMLLNLAEVQTVLGPILGRSDVAFVGQNIKYDAIVLANHGLPVRSWAFDTMVADSLLDPGGRNHDLDELAKRWLGHRNIPITDLIGTGSSAISMSEVPVEQVSTYACEDVDVPFRLIEPMRERLAEEDLSDVLVELEMPLLEVLRDMEREGIRVSTERLHSLGNDFQSRLDTLHGEVMALAGESFNPDSPKQLATILFDKLHLRVVKKTKTGPSTDAEVLEELATEHPLPAKIVEYRQFAKLKSTYVDALPKLISPRTHRLHTSFRQDIAATGRLSSVEPNLQNIPIRTAEGRSIRSAFLAKQEGWALVTADYSQIELRVLAHYSNDISMSRAFRENQDIHTMVAAEVNGVPTSEVTPTMRRNAKAVNFGIIYGQSPFGLAKGLGISRGEASEFIDRYFDRYPAVRGIRDFPSLPDNKKKQLLEPERMAINTVIQGSAADMIKMAMIEIARRLRSTDLQAKMLLQIHDELIFDCPIEEVPPLVSLVREAMTTVMPLSVPLQVDVKSGQTWADCEPLS